ncbi:MAG TPA: hypothetical protein VGN72_22820 [Tepidisphaeraceae bacterium]|jgi:hypothetical protein|nr:hypothetical protein [Tepidisphaeraceae bacterium]
MRQPNLPWFKEVIDVHQAPCVSIYMPMLRAAPPANENQRLFNELIDKVAAELASGYPKEVVEPLVNRITAEASGTDFWIGPRDGIAVFASSDYLRIVDLPSRPDARVDVADTFHVRPLITSMQADRRYHVLALTLRQAVLYEGNQYGVRRLATPGVPQDPHTVSKMRMSQEIDAASDIKTATTQYPQEGTIPAAVSEDLFLRAIDKAVWEQFSRDAKLPLVLMADENRSSAFRAISKNTYLLEQGSMVDPHHLAPERIHQETWKLIEPRFGAEAQDLVDQFQAARARKLGSDELAPVVEAAAVGRVDTLLIDANRQIPGRIEDSGDGATFQFKPAPAGDPRADDVLDDLAEMVLKTDGAVMILPPDLMPSDTGVAAIYRY